ncbi:MAG TPA: glucoamylase family protein [Ohtaekwangia sp.]
MNIKPLDELFSPLRQYFQKNSFMRRETSEQPLRSELFSMEQMDQHARHLAQSHHIRTEQSTEQLLKRLDRNEEVLFRVTNLLQDSVKAKKSITPAGEWLLDNFYLVEEQIRIAKRYLPKGYSKGLPQLSKGPSAGFPRVYDIAIEIISHSDGHVDIQSLSHFISIYQKINILTIGELWAIPIMLRLALLENLRRVAARIATDRIDGDYADYWADQILEIMEKDPKDLVLVIADMARSNPPMVSSFVAEFARRLQWKGPDLTLPLNWIEQHLTDSGQTINSLVLEENQKQAADQVSMSNSINSLRFLAKMDWREFVESLSVVEQVLRQDHNGVYPKMDFYSRDNYRHAVEKIAKKSGLAEHEVAQIAIDLAKTRITDAHTTSRYTHVGYYLLGQGIRETEKKSGIHRYSQASLITYRKWLYVAGSLLLTLLISIVAIRQIPFSDSALALPVLMAILSVLAASQLSLSLVNWATALIIKPNPLPKMDFSGGIPNESRTLVVVPTLINAIPQIDKLVEDLEVRFLANRDTNLLFALLTDFTDAKTQTLPTDESLVNHIASLIIRLNEKYSRPDGDSFLLFHRPRTWNASEKAWMGYERKRGKLEALNQLLRGKNHTAFQRIVGDKNIYETVKYVITLDTDTQLPRDSAWKLIGIMAHPLNQALYSEQKKRVIDGYGVIQPRLAISLHGASRTRFTQLHENDAGIDPYTRIVSDIYQDIFHEGSFIGKGIYDVDIFETVLSRRFPDNRILSHDLLEGAYTRCGFASDVQLYEEYPSHYSTDISRRHRWTRGDWQIANWFLPFVPHRNGRFHKNPVSALSRWKIFDNLRRSFIPIAMTGLLLINWLVLPSSWFWTLFVLSVVLLPYLFVSVWNIVRKPAEVSIQQHMNNSVHSTYKNFLQNVFTLICLPYEAYINVDAILRTGWRLIIGKKLLEWNPSGFIKQKKESLSNTYIAMGFSPLLAGVLMAFLIYNYPQYTIIATPFLICWIVSPFLAWWIGKPLPSPRKKLNEEQHISLRMLARKTWAFFENIIGVDDNWLPPDNLQQYPIPVIAHRTSPTNIGLSLLANLTAYDFGYSTTQQLLQRTHDTFSTLEKMERFQGHFFNWYHTQTLATLHPRYISSVDSGNLAGHLITLRQGLLELPHQKIIHKRLWSGLQDTARILDEVARESNAGAFSDLKDDFCNSLQNPPESLPEAKELLEKLTMRLTAVSKNVQLDTTPEVHEWKEKLSTHLNSIREEMIRFAPWIEFQLPEKIRTLKSLNALHSLQTLASDKNELIEELNNHTSYENTPEDKMWLEKIRNSVYSVYQLAQERIKTIQDLASQCTDFSEMEYGFLYDKSQHLLSIGYHVDERSLDNSFYDLLASEARLASFVAISQGKISQENWFALGRRLTTASGNNPVLLSWSGSMFEYLMPVLVMPTYQNTLLDETSKSTVLQQIEYGRQHSIPWGISESCYNIVDASLTYQYRAFGVPGIGFKRGLSEDLVIAPYASVMALMINPQAAYENLERLKKEGFEGKYGFFESIDYTPKRLPRGQSRVIIQTFMAHHQGMSFLSLAYLLLDQPMQRRFEADPQFQTALLLLQEQVPKATSFYSAATEIAEVVPTLPVAEMRVIPSSDTLIPEVQLLSNGRYHVMITNSGGGYSRWKDLAVTRWREDTVCDNWGTFCYIRNLNDGEFWSVAHHPTGKEATSYSAVFSQGRAEFRRMDHGIETHTEVIVSPEDDIEIRRVHISNRSRKKRKIEITSYAEVVLAAPVADAAHPAFSNLFVQTQILDTHNAIRCTRRARSKEERPPWMFHLMKFNGKQSDHISYETDREKFIGRGNSIANPHVMFSKEPLSGSEGSVLDPIASIQYRITLEEDETVSVDIITGMSHTLEENQALLDKYQDRHLRDRTFELSWTHSQVVLRQINATEADAQLYGRLTGSVIYSNPLLRANPNILIRNQRGQSSLWSYSISGDIPIVLVRISDSTNLSLVKQMIQARAYWQLKGVVVDLVILNEDHSGYRQVLQDQIQALVATGTTINTSDRQGGIFVRPADQVSNEDRILLQTVARVIITDSRGTLEDQINKRLVAKAGIPLLHRTISTSATLPASPVKTDLQFNNGVGGFSRDGKEYIITTSDKHRTPLPWINVIANPKFGTLVTESGPSYTWSENAHEFRLTPWHNDPVTGKSGEAFYIRDEITGAFWSPFPYPVQGNSAYTTRHGFGYSIFQHTSHGVETEACVHVDLESPIRFVVLKIKNHSGGQRKLSCTAYAEWVLGSLRDKSVMHVVAEHEHGALLSRNPYHPEDANRTAFFFTNDVPYHFTCDRLEFIGRNKTLHDPDAMYRVKLSGKYGAGLDSCAAIQVPFILEDGMSREIVFCMGAGKDATEARELIHKFRGNKVAHASLHQVQQFWQEKLSTVQIETPDASLNILTNGWLIYQVLSCRLWGRSGFYQSGGAFGFRDQLQDVLSLLHTAPQLAREHILLSASRQFKEGDVQHWWHPPVGRGVRTQCSDDFLWLPYVTSKYVTTTGDFSILDQQISFLEGRLLNLHEESYYDLPINSEQRADLYEHCKRSIHYGLRFGEHGLPLIGAGDWNDGMNLVGIEGKGESVWLGFFLYDVLIRFIPVAESRGDSQFVELCKQQATQLKANLNANAWDGNWFVRAWFDDGKRIGSSQNEECRIDSISQSWSVLSGAGRAEKSKKAMESVNLYLVNRTKSLIQLLDPPFDKSDAEPGYIKGYVPGVRENGGQYTHAAIWTVMAFAKLRERERTWELLKMINPINHGTSAKDIAIYKTEPYVVAADVYGVHPHTGRGGWTWYTGSAGWMYQLILESFLGLRRVNDTLHIEPCVPEEWDTFTVHYKFGQSVYRIQFLQNEKAEDGDAKFSKTINLVDDGKTHEILVRANANNKKIQHEHILDI